MFQDNSTIKASPFGIHSICQEGSSNLGIKPGQWYGPQMISIVLRNICQKMRPVVNFKIYVCLDASIFLDEIEAILKQGDSVLVLIPLRLGLDHIDESYLIQTKHLFRIYQNVGIAGGRDHMALYLVGDEDLNNPKSGYFYLDPHTI